MTAEEFMRDHAEKACTGRVAEILGDITPEAMSQLMPLMAGGPNPPTGNRVTPVCQSGEEHVFHVTYTGDGGKSVTLRETLRQIDGAWKIVQLEEPS